MISIDQFFSKILFYNTTLFNIYFALIIFVAAMRFTESFRQNKPVFKKAIVIGVLLQYFILPSFALLFTLVMQTSMEVTLAIFLLVSFPNNRFSLIITWISGGSTLYAVIMAFFSIVLSLVIVPFTLYLLIHVSPITRPIAVDYHYFEFIALIWKNRLDFLVLIAPTVLLGMTAGKYYPAVSDLIETRVCWLAYIFAVCVSFIAIGQRPEYFTDYWHFFSWKLFIYSLSVFILSYAVAIFFRLPREIGLALMISSGKYFVPVTLILLTSWYPGYVETDWLLYAQLGMTQWLFLILVFYFRYQIQYGKSSKINY